jgi:hypothetical protein
MMSDDDDVQLLPQAAQDPQDSTYQTLHIWLVQHCSQLNTWLMRRPRRPIDPSTLVPMSRVIYNKVKQISTAFLDRIRRMNCYNIAIHHLDIVELLFSFTELFFNYRLVKKLITEFKICRLRRVYSHIQHVRFCSSWSTTALMLDPSLVSALMLDPSLVSRLNQLAFTLRTMSLREFCQFNLQNNQDLYQLNQAYLQQQQAPPMLPPPQVHLHFHPPFTGASAAPAVHRKIIQKQRFVEHYRTEALELLQEPDKTYEKEEECHVCCEPITEPLSCGHFVHTKCIVMSKKCSCPFCFKSVLLSDQEYEQLYDLGARIVEA